MRPYPSPTYDAVFVLISCLISVDTAQRVVQLGVETMSYIPPHLRNVAQSTNPSNTSSSHRSTHDKAAIWSTGTSNPRSSYNLSGSRHAQPSAKPSPSRSSRRQDSVYALESDPNDIKPRRKVEDNGNTRRTCSASGQGLLDDMELIGTVSRSGGLGDENDACV